MAGLLGLLTIPIARLADASMTACNSDESLEFQSPPLALVTLACNRQHRAAVRRHCWDSNA